MLTWQSRAQHAQHTADARSADEEAQARHRQLRPQRWQRGMRHARNLQIPVCSARHWQYFPLTCDMNIMVLCTDVAQHTYCILIAPLGTAILRLH